jgi:hypothetical protein
MNDIKEAVLEETKFDPWTTPKAQEILKNKIGRNGDGSARPETDIAFDAMMKSRK